MSSLPYILHVKDSILKTDKLILVYLKIFYSPQTYNIYLTSQWQFCPQFSSFPSLCMGYLRYIHNKVPWVSFFLFIWTTFRVAHWLIPFDEVLSALLFNDNNWVTIGKPSTFLPGVSNTPHTLRNSRVFG